MRIVSSITWARLYTLKTQFVLNEELTNLMLKITILLITARVFASCILPQFQSRNREINIAVTVTYFGIRLWYQNTQRR